MIEWLFWPAWGITVLVLLLSLIPDVVDLK